MENRSDKGDIKFELTDKEFDAALRRAKREGWPMPERTQYITRENVRLTKMLAKRIGVPFREMLYRIIVADWQNRWPWKKSGGGEP